jgi:hypothetical protein
MSNTFVTPSAVIRDANLVLNDQLILGNLVNRTVEGEFARKVGSKVKVKSIPNMGSADTFTTTTSASAVAEGYVEVELTDHLYKRVDLTSDELSLQVDDFTGTVAVPCVKALIRSTESLILQRSVGGFSRYTVGTAGTSPSTIAHITAAEKKVFDNRGDNGGPLVGVISSTAHASFAQLNQFTSADYGADRPMGLRSNSLGQLSNVVWFRTPNAGTFDRGYLTGTIVVKTTVAAAESEIIIDGFTSATGTGIPIYEGTRFVVAGDATVYTITADADIAGSEATIQFTPALAAQATAEAGITFQSAQTTNIVYNPQGVAAAIVAPAAVGPLSAMSTINGIGIRIVSSDISTSTLAATWVFDIMVGCRVVMPEFGCVMQG